MSRRDFLPDADGAFQLWCEPFVLHVAADPLRYGLDDDIAAALESAFAAFALARDRVALPSTRTPVAICDKNQTRAALERLVRDAVRRIQAFGGTTELDRANLGIAPRRGRASRIGPPPTRPLLRPSPIRRGGVTRLLLVDEHAPFRTALPQGVASAVVFSCACPPDTDFPPLDPDAWRFEGLATRSTFRLRTRPSDAGSRVFITAAWASPRGQLGPRAVPVPASSLAA